VQLTIILTPFHAVYIQANMVKLTHLKNVSNSALAKEWPETANLKSYNSVGQLLFTYGSFNKNV